MCDVLITRFFPDIDHKLANAAASMSLLALLQFQLPPSTITEEETHYAPATPGMTSPQLSVASPRPSADGYGRFGETQTQYRTDRP